MIKNEQLNINKKNLGWGTSLEKTEAGNNIFVLINGELYVVWMPSNYYIHVLCIKKGVTPYGIENGNSQYPTSVSTSDNSITFTRTSSTGLKVTTTNNSTIVFIY